MINSYLIATSKANAIKTTNNEMDFSHESTKPGQVFTNQH